MEKRRNESGWEPEVAELRRREELARRMGGTERVERQHARAHELIQHELPTAARSRAGPVPEHRSTELGCAR